MLEGYLETKNILIQAIQELDYFIEKYGDRELTDLIAEQRLKLEKSQFNLAVLGQFKRGKSTLINALLGEEILPTGVLPLTAIITRLSYARERKAKVLFFNGQQEKIDLSDLAQYVTEKANPKNKKRVKQVNIYYPSPLLKKGVVLIDTPGIGSIYQNNTKVTENYIKYADAVIFILAVDPPMTEEEVNFLNTVKDIANKMVFVLNKVDLVGYKEQQEILEFSKEVIQERTGMKQVSIYPLSAKKALEGSFSADRQSQNFIQGLEKLILEQKGKIIINSVNNKILRVAERLLFNLKLEMKIIMEPLENLEEKIKTAREQLQVIEKRKKDFIYLFRGEIEELIKILDEDVASFKAKETERLQNEVSKELLTKKKGNIQEEVENYLEKEIKRSFEKWRQQEKEKLDQLLQTKTEEFVSEINKIIKEIQGVFVKLFDIDFFQLTPVDEIIESKDFYYQIKEVNTFYPKLELANFSTLLPTFISNKLISRKVKEEVMRQVDKNCGRLRYDFYQRIRETARKFISRWDREVEELIKKIDGIVERARKEKSKSMKTIEGKKDELKNDLQRINRIIEGLK